MNFLKNIFGKQSTPQPRSTASPKEIVLCSNCGRQLEFAGNSLGGDLPAFDHWTGNVCLSCKKVFCPNCIAIGGPTPCPICGTPTKSGDRRNLEFVWQQTSPTNKPPLLAVFIFSNGSALSKAECDSVFSRDNDIKSAKSEFRVLSYGNANLPNKNDQNKVGMFVGTSVMLESSELFNEDVGYRWDGDVLVVKIFKKV